MGFGKTASTAFSLNAYGYVFGGDDTINGILNELWQYDAAADAWSQKASMPDSARTYSSAFVIANMAYVFGGYNLSNSPSNDLWQYNPVANAWLSKAALPGNGRWASSAFSLNGKGYVVGGQGASVSFSELWEYTPDSVFAGVNEANSFFEASIYPNPTIDKITYTWSWSASTASTR